VATILRTTRTSARPPYHPDNRPSERGRRFCLALAFLLTTAVTLPAQDVATTNSALVPLASQIGTLPDAPSASREPESESFADGVGTLVKTIGLDEWHIIKAPFQKKALVWDAVVIGATGVLIANDESVLHQVQPQWHDTSINVSSATVYATAATAGGIFVTGLFTHSDHATETGIRSAEAAIDSALLYGAMKAITARQRPYMGNGDGKFFSGNWSSGSFPSGHSAMAWTLASVVAHEYPSWPVRILMYGLATTASTARVTAGVHFPADVFAGGVMGYLIGDYVASKPSAKKTSTARSRSRIRRMPEAVLQHVAIGGQ
jgi:membrane-associated phospholipid phosphatase